MAEQLYAVAISESGMLAGHAGRAKHWRVFVVDDDELQQLWDIRLTAVGCLHEWHVRDDGMRHPLHSVDVAFAGSAGEGVIRRLAERGTALITTSETDPQKVILDYLKGEVAQGRPHEEQACAHEQEGADHH